MVDRAEAVPVGLGGVLGQVIGQFAVGFQGEAVQMDPTCLDPTA